MKNKLNYAMALAAIAPFVALAEGDATMDTTAATTMLTSAQTGLTSLLSAAAGILTAIVLAGLAIWGALAIVRIVKKAFKTGS